MLAELSALLWMAQVGPRVFIVERGRIAEYDSRGVFQRNLASVREPFLLSDVSQSGRTAVYFTPRCEPFAGDIRLLDRRTQTSRRITTGPYFFTPPLPGTVEVYADAAIAPDGSRVAFALRVCNLARRLDLVEASGPIAIWTADKDRVQVLSSSVTSDGGPLGFANSLAWAPDGRRLLASFETGFAVFRPDTETVEYMHDEPDGSWSHALGFVGSNCVAYITGDPLTAQDRSPPFLVNLSNRTKRPLPEAVGLNASDLAGLRQIAYPNYLVQRGRTIHLLGPDGKSILSRPAATTVSLVADGDSGPAGCGSEDSRP